MNGDILAEIRLLDSSEGGRRSKTPSTYLSCLFEIHGRHHDCRVLMGSAGELAPGDTAERAIWFLNPEMALKDVSVGDEFHLLELKRIGSGEVLAIL